MANCPICGKYVADDEYAVLLLSEDPNCTLAHGDCVESLESNPDLIATIMENYMYGQ